MTSSITKANGRPMITVAFCSAGTPPTRSIATVSSPVTVVFGLKNMGVAPAGVDKPATGHHHLLVDVKQMPALDRPLPADAQHRHFGGGQTETVLELSPGRHTLQLVLGDYTHTPHVPPVISPMVTITVQ